MSTLCRTHNLALRAPPDPGKEHSSSPQTLQNPEFHCEHCKRRCASSCRCKHCCKDVCNSCSTVHQRMYPSVLLSRVLALQGRYRRVSRHTDKLDSTLSAEMFRKLQCQIEEDIMVAASCLDAVNTLCEEKNRIPLNDAGVDENHLTSESPTEASKDLGSNYEPPQSTVESSKSPLEPQLAKGRYLCYNLLSKKSKIGAPPFDAVKEYFLKLGGVEAVYCLPPGNKGYIVFKSRAYAQDTLTSGKHAVNGCEIKLTATRRLAKTLRKFVP